MSVEIDTLEVEVRTSAKQASSGISDLTSSLERLKTVAKGGAGLTAVSKQLQTLTSSTQGAVSASQKVSNLASALSKLQGIQKSSGMNSVANALKKINEINLSNISVDKMQSLTTALNELGSVQKSDGLNSAVNALRKIPDIIDSLDDSKLSRFATQMNKVAASIRPLATEMQKVSNGFAAFPIRIQKIISSNAGLTASNTKAAKSFSLFSNNITGTLANITLFGYTIDKIADVVSDWVKSANDYVENINLFQVSMGEFYGEAYEYSQLVNDKLGIDPSEWMRNQGVFMSMANGFGLARDQAYALSEGLTELSYDLSSLYNEDVEQSALRLQSALSGEIEPIRRLGISISQATLQEYALEQGINENIEAMTEQEKAILRTLVLMEGAGRIGAIGDFAKTLESPANSLRVLNQQITQLGRALGQVLVPILIQVIPYIQAFVEIVTEAIQKFATLVGFTMPNWNDDITSGADDTTDSMEDATEATKELKNALLGIDELNILSPNSKSSSGNDSGWVNDIEIPNIWDQEVIENLQSKVDELKKPMKEVLDLALLIGGALLAWKIASTLMPAIRTVGELLSVMLGKQMALSSSAADLLSKWNAIKKTVGLALMITGFSLEFSGAAAIGRGDAELMDYIKTAIGAALGIAGSLLVFGTGPLGWTIGITAAILIAIAGISFGESERLSALVEEAFFNYNEGAITITDFANSYANLFEQISNANNKIAESGNTVIEANDKISSISSTFQTLVSAIEYGAYSIAEKKDEIVSTFEQLADGIEAALSGSYDVIVSAVVSPLGDSLGLVNEKTKTYLSTVLGVKEEAIEAVQSLRGELSTLEEQYNSGTISEDEFLSRSITLWTELSKYTKDGSSEIQTAFSGIENSLYRIDWQNANAANEAFGIISGAASQARDSVDAAVKGINESFDTYISVALATGNQTAANQLQELQNMVVEAYESQYGEIDRLVTESTNIMQGSLIQGLQSAAEAAQADWQQMGFFRKLFFYNNDETQYMNAALKEQVTGIVKTLSNEMQSAFESEGFSGDWFVEDMAKSIQESMEKAMKGNYNANGIGFQFSPKISTEEFEESLQNLINESLNEISTNTYSGGQDIGTQLSNGIAAGVQKESNVLGVNLKSWADGILGSVRSAFGIHSPSRVFRDQIGTNIGLGVAEGIADTIGYVSSAASDLITKAQSVMSINAASIDNAMPKATVDSPEMQSQILNSISSTSIENLGLQDEIENSNNGVINAVMAMGQAIVKAINDQETSVQLDGKVVSRALYSYNQQVSREKGSRLVTGGVAR